MCRTIDKIQQRLDHGDLVIHQRQRTIIGSGFSVSEMVRGQRPVAASKASHYLAPLPARARGAMPKNDGFPLTFVSKENTDIVHKDLRNLWAPGWLDAQSITARQALRSRQGRPEKGSVNESGHRAEGHSAPEREWSCRRSRHSRRRGTQ